MVDIMASHFTPGKEPRYLLNGGWVNTRAGLGDSRQRKISCSYQDTDLGPSSQQPTLYRLSCSVQ
jgi:hypothetical protein